MRVDDVINKKDGGNAVSDTSRISLEHFLPTLLEIEDQILSLFGLRLKDVGILGSSGKKPDSGDIDIAIKMDFDTAVNLLPHNITYKSMKPIGICSMGFPIYNHNYEKTGEYVQVDLMFVDSIEWAKFAYYSSPKSNYKGLFRNEVFYSVARICEYDVLEKHYGEDVKISRLQFDLNKGLMRLIQSKVGKTGKICKSFKTKDKQLISNDVKTVIERLFGVNVTEDDVSTFEGCMSLIQSPNFIHKDKLDDILNLMAVNCINKVRKHKLLSKEDIDTYMCTMGKIVLNTEENFTLWENKTNETLRRIFK